MEAGKLRVRIVNAVRGEEKRVESNKIGLQTCLKLISTMGGEFRKKQTAQEFAVEIILPLY